AESAAHRQLFFNPDVRSLMGAGCLLQASGSLVDKVGFIGHAWNRGGDQAFPCAQGFKTEGVTQIHELKQGLQIVVTIGPPSGNVQEQVEL
ncbi:MAG TPA: hypothetical protein DD667_20360, partial [Gammaproteobacteria bacterium]|nr:hypothetical protein [Gammaproteobacteria bacterium]